MRWRALAGAGVRWHGLALVGADLLLAGVVGAGIAGAGLVGAGMTAHALGDAGQRCGGWTVAEGVDELDPGNLPAHCMLHAAWCNSSGCIASIG